MNLSEEQKQIIAEVAGGAITIFQEQHGHFKFTPYGKNHQKDIFVLVLKGLLELLPPDPTGKTKLKVIT